jgi:hypothetical protein
VPSQPYLKATKPYNRSQSFFRSDRDLATSLAEFKDEDSYRIDSNFFRGMHEVRATAYPSFLLHVVRYSISTNDLSSASGVSKD